MSERRVVRKMLRQMASGEPVAVAPVMATVKTFARLAFIAEQFGYAYEDTRRGGPQGDRYVMSLVPDHGPQSRERAARNRERYPRAADSGGLPPLVPAGVELLKARIGYDIVAVNTSKLMAAVSSAGFTVLALCLGVQLGVGTTGAAVIGAVWALLMAFIAVGFVRNRRCLVRQAALLRAAGFTPVTEPGGRLRYLPPGGQLPGHGNALRRTSGPDTGTSA
ncbi:hypothetical protein ACFVZC_27370 [Streptomyces marokkonensis]|uniref:Integral membrane protein n=1 Tax=Streptomyces marokkonensis TaxID=324855 RepID=A0ABW6QCZ7_9ACTN